MAQAQAAGFRAAPKSDPEKFREVLLVEIQRLNGERFARDARQEYTSADVLTHLQARLDDLLYLESAPDLSQLSQAEALKLTRVHEQAVSALMRYIISGVDLFDDGFEVPAMDAANVQALLNRTVDLFQHQVIANPHQWLDVAKQQIIKFDPASQRRVSFTVSFLGYIHLAQHSKEPPFALFRKLQTLSDPTNAKLWLKAVLALLRVLSNSITLSDYNVLLTILRAVDHIAANEMEPMIDRDDAYPTQCAHSFLETLCTITRLVLAADIPLPQAYWEDALDRYTPMFHEQESLHPSFLKWVVMLVGKVPALCHHKTVAELLRMSSFIDYMDKLQSQDQEKSVHAANAIEHYCNLFAKCAENEDVIAQVLEVYQGFMGILFKEVSPALKGAVLNLMAEIARATGNREQRLQKWEEFFTHSLFVVDQKTQMLTGDNLASDILSEIRSRERHKYTQTEGLLAYMTAMVADWEPSFPSEKVDHVLRFLLDHVGRRFMHYSYATFTSKWTFINQFMALMQICLVKYKEYPDQKTGPGAIVYNAIFDHDMRIVDMLLYMNDDVSRGRALLWAEPYGREVCRETVNLSLLVLRSLFEIQPDTKPLQTFLTHHHAVGGESCKAIKSLLLILANANDELLWVLEVLHILAHLSTDNNCLLSGFSALTVDEKDAVRNALIICVHKVNSEDTPLDDDSTLNLRFNLFMFKQPATQALSTSVLQLIILLLSTSQSNRKLALLLTNPQHVTSSASAPATNSISFFDALQKAVERQLHLARPVTQQFIQTAAHLFFRISTVPSLGRTILQFLRSHNFLATMLQTQRDTETFWQLRTQAWLLRLIAQDILITESSATWNESALPDLPSIAFTSPLPSFEYNSTIVNDCFNASLKPRFPASQHPIFCSTSELERMLRLRGQDDTIVAAARELALSATDSDNLKHATIMTLDAWTSLISVIATVEQRQNIAPQASQLSSRLLMKFALHLLEPVTVAATQNPTDVEYNEDVMQADAQCLLVVLSHLTRVPQALRMADLCRMHDMLQQMIMFSTVQTPTSECLYSSFCHLLQLTQLASTSSTSKFPGLRDSRRAFMEKVAEDACNTLTHGSLMPLATLTLIIQYEPVPMWLNFLARSSRLDHVVELMRGDCPALADFVATPPSEVSFEFLRHIARAKLLLRVCLTESGPKYLSDANLTEAIADSFVFLDVQADLTRSTKAALYRTQLAVPVVQCVAQLAAAVKRQDTRRLEQLCRIVQCHMGYFTSVLQHKVHNPTQDTLEELAAVTLLFRSLGSHDMLMQKYFPDDHKLFRHFIIDLCRQCTDISSPLCRPQRPDGPDLSLAVEKVLANSLSFLVTQLTMPGSDLPFAKSIDATEGGSASLGTLLTIARRFVDSYNVSEASSEKTRLRLLSTEQAVYLLWHHATQWWSSIASDQHERRFAEWAELQNVLASVMKTMTKHSTLRPAMPFAHVRSVSAHMVGFDDFVGPVASRLLHFQQKLKARYQHSATR
eukprot:m.361327 g.361327  ORF g.361327 m.361327 type:complete len:1491 (+) comp19483_c0_seq1:13-4485(+)